MLKPMTADLSHFDAEGRSRMVDVGDKPITRRMARASGVVTMRAATLAQIRSGEVSKGNVLEVARVAGILAAKRTSETIPLCHTLPLDAVEIAFHTPDDTHLKIEATVGATARTGVEIEALLAVSTAALTVYDMCKGVDRGIVIGQIQLEEKLGGRTGHYRRDAAGG
jgi:cyclic pyranopterin phosphate synthase